MAGLLMFNDLPSIDIEDGSFNRQLAYHSNGADMETFWAPVNTTLTYMRNVPFYSTDRSLQQDALEAHSYLQQLPASLGKPSFISEASTWHNDSSQLKSHLNGGWETQRPQNYQPLWPHPFPKARYNSPDGSMGGDRSATELDSSTGGSVWSPRRSAGYFEPTEHLDMDYLPGSQSQDHGSAPPHGAFSSSHNLPSAPGAEFGDGVALRDVQEYPDGESEVHIDQFDDEETKMSQQSSYLEFARPHGCLPEALQSQRNYDEGIGSSIHDESPSPSIKGEDDMSMVDDVKEEDEDDDVSDYTPAGRSKRNYHTRKSSTTKAPSSPTKRSSRGKRSPKLAPSNKVSKRRTKATPLNPTSPLKPMTANPTAISTHGNTTSNTCPNCHQTFATPSAMHKHNLTTHTRPFTCTFGPYGCPSRFGSKNEWKRHVSSQHIQLGIWRCDQCACIPQPSHRLSSSSASKKRGTTATKGNEKDDIIVLGGPAVEPTDGSFNEFNRKDLFTQHLRRMHFPPRSASAEREAFEASLEATRRRCWIKTRDPPPSSVCGYCCNGDRDIGGLKNESVFEGPESWDERMEHVGRHMERGHAGREWREDVVLREWMVREGLIVWEEREGKWVLGGS
ncbi:MAG: hypothetical protein FRX48_01156 [Lasallia pustulata]|uniref:C2H2-type domain-containing protein n=1 Tax=Lasallia pustulata TaxID=136370 RepID=A0A5M8PY92_9LECA|nr:MAG: hypothetical protein FRX48_01156 [Lasallia pustulata]